MAECAGIGGVKKFHCPQINLAASEHEADPGIEVEVFPGNRRERFMNKGENGIVFLTENLCVIRVGGHAFETEKKDMFERLDIRIYTGGRPERSHICLVGQPFKCLFRLIIHARGFFINRRAGFFRPVFQSLTKLNTAVNQFHETIRVEIYIGES